MPTFHITIALETRTEDDAASWAAAVLDLNKPSCNICLGEGILHNSFGNSRSCPTCGGSGKKSHPYNPTVVKVSAG